MHFGRYLFQGDLEWRCFWSALAQSTENFSTRTYTIDMVNRVGQGDSLIFSIRPLIPASENGLVRKANAPDCIASSREASAPLRFQFLLCLLAFFGSPL